MPSSARCRKAGGKKASCKQVKRYATADVKEESSLMPHFALTSQEDRPVAVSEPEVLKLKERFRHYAGSSFSALLDLVEPLRFYLVSLLHVTMELSYLYLVLRLHGIYERHVVEPLPFGEMKVVSAALGLLLLAVNFWMVIKFIVARFKDDIEQRK